MQEKQSKDKTGRVVGSRPFLPRKVHNGPCEWVFHSSSSWWQKAVGTQLMSSFPFSLYSSISRCVSDQSYRMRTYRVEHCTTTDAHCGCFAHDVKPRGICSIPAHPVVNTDWVMMPRILQYHTGPQQQSNTVVGIHRSLFSKRFCQTADSERQLIFHPKV